MSSISLRNIFLRSIPRPMTWRNTPRAFNLANLGITFNFLQPHPVCSAVGELGMRRVRGYQCRSEFDAPGLDYIFPSTSFVAALQLDPSISSIPASYETPMLFPITVSQLAPRMHLHHFPVSTYVSPIRPNCGQCHSDLVSIIGSVLKYGCKQKKSWLMHFFVNVCGSRLRNLPFYQISDLPFCLHPQIIK